MTEGHQSNVVLVDSTLQASLGNLLTEDHESHTTPYSKR